MTGVVPSLHATDHGQVLHFPPPLETNGKISAEDLLTSAQKLLPKDAFLGPLLDSHYTIIKHQWLKDKFLPFYRRSVETLKDVSGTEGEESADCDDFSSFLRQMIGLSGIVARCSGPAAAQMVVFQAKSFSGVGRTRERHEVGLFLTERGWFVLEPQNASELVPIDQYANRRTIQYITFH